MLLLLQTLRAWGLIIDEMHFLAGAPKGRILDAIKPHIFFDDQHGHIKSAQKYGVPGAQVLSLISPLKSCAYLLSHPIRVRHSPACRALILYH